MTQYGYHDHYAHAGHSHSGPPPVVPAPPSHPSYTYTAPAPSAFSPHHMNYDAAPSSPLVVNAVPSPAPSIGGRSRASSHVRDYDRPYLETGGYGHRRNDSQRGRMVVEGGRRRRRYIQDDYDDYSDEEDEGSEYSYESRSRGPSRGHSRGPSHSRKYKHHTRTPSWASGESFDDRYAVAVQSKPSKAEEELNAKLRQVEEQLKRVQMEGERKRLQEKQAEMEKARNEEIERKVQEQLAIQKREEAEREWRAREAAEQEKARIAAAAKKLLDEQAAAAAAEAAAAEAEQQKINALLEAERQKMQATLAAAQGPAKKTYTRFSKAHLCKEALEERQIPFTEESDYFLVHRVVDKPEQQYLWARTKEIRTYYRQIQEAAEHAPMVRGPDGGWVKYVQIAGQPYPMALPVTITKTPGGAEKQRIDPIKLKWSDIFGKR